VTKDAIPMRIHDARTAENMSGRDAGGNSPVSLVIPCRAEYIALCRLVAGALGARESLDEELIADLKVVVTEACACFLGEHCGPLSPDGQAVTAVPTASLRMDINATADAWEIAVSDPDHRLHIRPSSECDPLSEGGLGLMIIRALVDTVEHTDSDTEGSVLRLVKRLPAEPALPS